jgi:hypothetical protein
VQLQLENEEEYECEIEKRDSRTHLKTKARSVDHKKRTKEHSTNQDSVSNRIQTSIELRLNSDFSRIFRNLKLKRRED